MSKRLEPNRASVAHAPLQVDSPSRRRVIVFRVLAGLTGLLFLFLAVSNALSPWAATTPSAIDTQPELHRWFLAMSGATDLIGAVCLLALALRPQGRELLALNFGLGIAMATLIVVPFTPGFLFLLLLFVPVLASYPYRQDLAPRSLLQPRPLLTHTAVAVGSAAVLLAIAVLALRRQIDGADSAALAGTWAEYAEHAAGLAAASLLAVSQRPGFRILRGACAFAWLYLGGVAAFVLPHQQASWGQSGGALAMTIGAFYTWTALSRNRVPMSSTPQATNQHAGRRDH